MRRLSWLVALLTILILPKAAAATLIRSGANLAPALANPIQKLDQELTTNHPQIIALAPPRRAKNAPLPTSETRAYLVHNKTGWLVVVVNRPEKGSTQLIHSRYYNATTGRMISRDSVGPTVGDLSYNPYSYCENSPLNKVDRSGERPIIDREQGDVYGQYMAELNKLRARGDEVMTEENYLRLKRHAEVRYRSASSPPTEGHQSNYFATTEIGEFSIESRRTAVDLGGQTVEGLSYGMMAGELTVAGRAAFGAGKVILGRAAARESAIATESAVAESAVATEVSAARGVDLNKLHHIFDKAGRNLDEIVTATGSREAAFQALERGAQAAVNAGKLTGRFETVVNVGGVNVTVRVRSSMVWPELEQHSDDKRNTYHFRNKRNG